MIKYDYEITVNGNQAKLNKDIYLFRGNKNVHYYFAVKNASFNFKGSTDLIEKTNAINAAVTVIKPNNVEVASAIAKVENGKIHLKVTEDLIDEEVEVGDFDLVFDLFDDTDGAVTIPKVIGQFHVLERPCTTPISELVATNTTNEVDQALTDYAIVTYAEPVASTNADGTFAKKTWVAKEKITTAELNRMEEGISDVSSQCKDIAKQVENVGQPTQQQINTAIDKAIEEGKITGSGSINSTAKTLLETILQNAVYTSDQSSNITALISALGSNESGGGDTPTVKTYTITNTLTHCSNSNTSTSIDENSSYVATITPVDGYTLTDASVNITMGEVDVTSTVYNSGSINIPSVTGNIVISVSAIIIPSTPTFTALTPTMLARPSTDKMLYYYLFDNVESIDTSDTSKISQNASWRYGVYDCSNLSTVTIKRKVNKKGYSGSDVFLAFNQFPTMYTYNADATQVGTTDVCYKAFNLPPTGYDNSINVGDILEYELTINADYPYIVSVLSGTKNESSTDINDYIDENGYINFTTGTIDPLIVGIKE